MFNTKQYAVLTLSIATTLTSIERVLATPTRKNDKQANEIKKTARQHASILKDCLTIIKKHAKEGTESEEAVTTKKRAAGKIK